MIEENSRISWLLDASTPTIRYLTLKNLLKLPENDPLVTSVKNEIDRSGPVPAILAKQVTPGKWKYKSHYYTPKYTSTHWSLMLLEELQINPLEKRFQAGIEFMLEVTQQDIHKYHKEDNTSWTCLWGNIIRYAVYGGYYLDERLQEILHLTTISLSKTNCNCRYNQNYACSWGVARTLWGLAAIPEMNRSLSVQNAINRGIDFLLNQYDLVSANYPTPDGGKIHPLWSKISFPLFYQADILMVLRILAQLDQLDQPAVQPALDWLLNRQRVNGRWRGSSPFRKRTWSEMGDPEETDRWVSLQACQVLLQAGKINIDPL